ncbi:MAG: hypothetical protein FLDDKLPJ_02552 [Phycisphaerae bacterium]|nr:hypothetical protein [Phycisphaerae bacterium]
MRPLPPEAAASAILAVVLAACGAASARQTSGGASDVSTTIEVTLTLPDGVEFTGKVVDQDEHAVIVFADGAPHVFAWRDQTGGSEYRVRKALLRMTRGADGLTAEDHFRLGVRMLERDETQLAVNEFRDAARLDRTYDARAREAMSAQRDRRTDSPPPASPADPSAFETPPASGTAELLESLASSSDELRIRPTPPEQVEAVTARFRAFFDPRLKSVIGPEVSLVETAHFLIWTDLPASQRPSLADAAERMYDALCRQFEFDPASTVFLGKCPVFCFRSKGRFLRFARAFDGYRETNAAGYTRSVEDRGYVHVALFYQGQTREDWKRFLCTLVHEGSHAFLHRLHASRLIPGWINEGYADLMTERVLGEDSFTGECAALLGKAFARHDWPVHNLMRGSGPILVHQYPVAHSLVGWLESRDSRSFMRFILLLKEGNPVETALASAFEGMSLEAWESGWRASCRDPETTPPSAGAPSDASAASRP